MDTEVSIHLPEEIVNGQKSVFVQKNNIFLDFLHKKTNSPSGESVLIS